jgi:tetratricopeptide (TPR) repeat protein
MLSDKDRSIVQVYRAECNASLGNTELALDLCVEVARYAQGSVLGHAYYLEARLAAALGDLDRALGCYQRGWEVEGSGRAIDSCGYSYCEQLLRRDQFERCLVEVHRVRQRARFPIAARVCAIGAAALAALGKSTELISEMLTPVFWAMDVQDLPLLWGMAASGYEGVLAEVSDEVLPLATRWMLGDNAVSAPPELNVDRQVFIEYRLPQLLTYSAAACELHERPDPSTAEAARATFRRMAPIELSTVYELADSFLDQGEVRTALRWYRGVVDALADERLTDVVLAQLVLAGAAYKIGSVNRRLGQLEDAIRWGELALRVNSRPILAAHADPKVVEDSREGSASALQLIGNCYFDQGHFTTSYQYHLKALQTDLGLESFGADCRSVIEAVGTLPSVSSRTVLGLINLGNSLGYLDDDDLYEMVRIRAVLAAARMADLERYAAEQEGRLMLGMLLAIFEFQLYSDDPAVDVALSRIRKAFGHNPPTTADYIRRN